MKLYYLCFLSVACFGLNSVKAITCPQLVDAVMEYFEHIIEGPFGEYIVKDIVRTTGVNVGDRDEVELIFCAVLNSETKSITDISASLKGLNVPPVNLAYGYITLMAKLKITGCDIMETEGKCLTDVLTEAGFDDVTRGGPELYTCEFISELVWETLRYALDIYGEKIKQSEALRLLRLDFSIEDEYAVKSFVCSLVKVKSVAELSSLLPHVQEEAYRNVAFVCMKMLVQPEQYINPFLNALTLVRVACRVGFPDFPLLITKVQAKQLAVVAMSANIHHELDEAEFADALQNADSMKDLESQFSSSTPAIKRIQEITRMVKGKEDKAITMVVNLFALVKEAEKYGLFMLPDN